MRFNESSIDYYLKKGAVNMSNGPKGYIDFRHGVEIASICARALRATLINLRNGMGTPLI